MVLLPWCLQKGETGDFKDIQSGIRLENMCELNWMVYILTKQACVSDEEIKERTLTRKRTLLHQEPIKQYAIIQNKHNF